MNKVLFSLIAFSLLTTSGSYYGSTAAPVTLVGGVIKAKHVQENTKKYKRKDCPVCEGKGWYISGDDIKKVDCGYCEPENKTSPYIEVVEETKKITPPPPSIPQPITTIPCPPCNPTIIKKVNPQYRQ